MHAGRCTGDVSFRDLADLLIGCIGGIQKGQVESGSRLESLGVTENWNNPVDKKYSRNLRKGGGIELVYSGID
jgi:hypothetical protein